VESPYFCVPQTMVKVQTGVFGVSGRRVSHVSFGDRTLKTGSKQKTSKKSLEKQ